MTPLAGLYVAACLLLVVAGPAKVLRPHDLARALRQVFGRTGSVGATTVNGAVGRSDSVPRILLGAVRVFAAGEAAVGLIGLLSPRLGAWPVASSYVVFAATVFWVRARDGVLATCGCFGGVDSPATWAHVVLDAGGAGAAVSVAMQWHGGSTPHAVASHPLSGVAIILGGALTAWLAVLVMGLLAQLAAVRRSLTSPAPTIFSPVGQNT